MRHASILLLLLAPFTTGCQSHVSTPTQSVAELQLSDGPQILSTTVFSCFEPGLMRGPDKPASCEPSAIAVHHGRVILGNDKPIPGEARSPVFSLNFDQGILSPRPDVFHTDTPFRMARKYEDFSTTPDGRWAFATTGFDRILDTDPSLDVFNTLLYWPVDRPAAVSIAQMSSRSEQASSAGLRAEMKRALANEQFPEGPPYWKIEALAAIPGDVLLFGVREIGESYEKFSYSTQILALPYKMGANGFQATGPIESVYSFDTSAVPETVAISGLEYAPATQTLWLLTSFERDESAAGVGGYLWSLKTTGLPLTQAPTLVRQSNQQPLMFTHKSEGVAPLDTHRLMIIHDDDRRTGTDFGRELHQAVLQIVQIP